MYISLIFFGNLVSNFLPIKLLFCALGWWKYFGRIHTTLKYWSMYNVSNGIASAAALLAGGEFINLHKLTAPKRFHWLLQSYALQRDIRGRHMATITSGKHRTTQSWERQLWILVGRDGFICNVIWNTCPWSLLSILFLLWNFPLTRYKHQWTSSSGLEVSFLNSAFFSCTDSTGAATILDLWCISCLLHVHDLRSNQCKMLCSDQW